MTRLMLITLLIPLVYASSSFAQESRVSLESQSRLELDEVKPESDLNTTLNLQMGASSFDYSGDNSKKKNNPGLATAVTLDFGEFGRYMETGFIYYQSNSALVSKTGESRDINNSYLGLPIMAKFFFSDNSKGLYLKGGMMTSFLMQSSADSEVRKLDVVGSVGVGGKFPIDPRSDFMIETTYNRGFLDQIKSRGDTNNQGLLILGGMTFRL